MIKIHVVRSSLEPTARLAERGGDRLGRVWGTTPCKRETLLILGTIASSHRHCKRSSDGSSRSVERSDRTRQHPMAEVEEEDEK
jgi:hypothetical protein